MSWLDACTAALLGGCCLRLVQHCWHALVGWRFLCVCAFGGFLLQFLIAYACLPITSLCNTKDNSMQASTRVRHLSPQQYLTARYCRQQVSTATVHCTLAAN